VRCAACALALAGSSCGETVRLGEFPSGADGSTSTSSTAQATGDGGACPTGQVSAGEVVWIGDSWVTVPGTQHTVVRDLARAAGAIGPNDDYVDVAAPGALMSAIASQYSTQEAGPVKVKVLIMDGGGFDLLVSNGSAASATNAAMAFKQLLATIANDGTVQQVIYFLVPEASVPGVPLLRTGMQDACMQSTVPCYFLDLQPLWAGHPEYMATGGVVASDAGAVVLGNKIWALMQQNCIAQ
jgi:hypothetical protein